jgi:hypothetical protein
MRVEIEKLEDESHELTVSDLSEEEARAFEADPELLVVGLERDDNVYRRIFRAGTPYLDVAVDNLRRLHPEVLQQADPNTVPEWERAVGLVLQRLAGTGVEWMFIGGAALAVQGVQIIPGDVDVITNVAGAKAMNDLFSDCLITPAAPLPDWGYFGRAFHGAKIEWAGNDPGQNPQMWNLGAPQRVVSWRGHQIRVALLETYLQIERNRGRVERIAAIEDVLSTAAHRQKR